MNQANKVVPPELCPENFLISVDSQSPLPVKCPHCLSGELICDGHTRISEGIITSLTLTPNGVYCCADCGEDVE